MWNKEEKKAETVLKKKDFVHKYWVRESQTNYRIYTREY